MSLHDSANQVQSAGRGEDKVLVHMTPNEVSGLQSLAMAHGGSLTINPETGLPEAGFLSSLLPMAIGFGLAPFTGGLSAALITGAGYTAATGSLKQGIMAGLGAYGGAGLGQGLMAQGAQAAPSAAAGSIDDIALASKNSVANSQIGAGYGNTMAQPQVFGQPAVGTGGGMAGFQTGVPTVPTYAQTQANILNSPMLKPTPTVEALGGGQTLDPRIYGRPESAFVEKSYPSVNGQILGRANPVPNAYTAGDPAAYYKYPLDKAGRGYSGAYSGSPTEMGIQRLDALRNQGITPSAEVIPSAGAPVETRTIKDLVRPDASSQGISRSFTDRTSQLGRGFSASTKDFEGLKGLYNAMPEYSVLASGITLADAMKPEDLKEKKDKSLIRPYEFDYGSTNVSGDPYSGSAERTYFNPIFTAKTPYESPGPEYAAAGGLMGYAVGGPVEDMAAMNSVGANTGYPMANLQTPMYSNPAMQRPEATNVLAPSADAGVGTYSGETRFAPGGPVDTRPFFNPNTSGMSAENYTRSELAGGRRAPIATPAAAPSNQYTYDPKTMQFTQTGGKGEVSGGVAQLAAQPITQPTNPAQPLIPNINIPAYQTPEQQLGLGGFYDMMNQQLGAYGGYQGYAAGGGVSHLGDYSDGGRLLKGPGDGVSDSIPASIGSRQPARLADGEFVVPARIVSEIGNGSTEAGARKLYAMMERVQKARRKTVGKGKVAVNSKAENMLPA